MCERIRALTECLLAGLFLIYNSAIHYNPDTGDRSNAEIPAVFPSHSQLPWNQLCSLNIYNLQSGNISPRLCLRVSVCRREPAWAFISFPVPPQQSQTPPASSHSCSCCQILQYIKHRSQSIICTPHISGCKKTKRVLFKNVRFDK